jgi:hypothetical protein
MRPEFVGLAKSKPVVWKRYARARTNPMLPPTTTRALGATFGPEKGTRAVAASAKRAVGKHKTP